MYVFLFPSCSSFFVLILRHFLRAHDLCTDLHRRCTLCTCGKCPKSAQSRIKHTEWLWHFGEFSLVSAISYDSAQVIWEVGGNEHAEHVFLISAHAKWYQSCRSGPCTNSFSVLLKLGRSRTRSLLKMVLSICPWFLFWLISSSPNSLLSLGVQQERSKGDDKWQLNWLENLSYSQDFVKRKHHILHACADDGDKLPIPNNLDQFVVEMVIIHAYKSHNIYRRKECSALTENVSRPFRQANRFDLNRCGD